MHMELPVEVVQLKRRDLRELLLIAKVYYPTEAWLTLPWLESMEKRAVAKLGVRWNGRLVGGLLATADKVPNVWLDLMVVDRNVTRRGIGEKLFTSLERTLQPGTIVWHLVPDKKAFTPSVGFVGKVRMESAGSLKKWFAGRYDALVFSKKVR